MQLQKRISFSHDFTTSHNSLKDFTWQISWDFLFLKKEIVTLQWKAFINVLLGLTIMVKHHEYYGPY